MSVADPAPVDPVDTAHPVFALSERYVEATAAAAPAEATLAGLPGHDDRWGDLGPDGVEAQGDVLRTTRDDLRRLPPPTGRWSQLAVRVLAEAVDDELAHHEAGEPYLDVTHLASSVATVRRVLELQGTGDAATRAAVLRRLGTVDDALAGWRRRVEHGRRRGLVNPARQVRSVIAQLERLARDDGAFARVAAELVQADASLDAVVPPALARARTAAAETATWLRDHHLPAAPDHDGVGTEHHARHATSHLGVADFDTDDAYAWGWERLRELWSRAEDVAHRISGRRDVLGVLRELRADPACCAPSPEAFRELMLARQLEAVDRLDGHHFDVPAGAREVEVRLATAAPPGAFYIGPAEDGSRLGTLWWSFGDAQLIPIFDEVSTGYHEGFPGHHLQISVQQHLADRLSRAHRTLLWRTGYGEGWALYAEQLMDELGFLETPEDELGYLTSVLFRVVRVVTDIGLHTGRPVPDDAPVHAGARWTHQVAVDVLEQLGTLPRAKADSEATRQLGWPAQAISYALGQRAVLELREERRTRDGAAFQAKAFHADVLGSGPVGLDLLGELVRSPGGVLS